MRHAKEDADLQAELSDTVQKLHVKCMDGDSDYGTDGSGAGCQKEKLRGNRVRRGRYYEA
ncbi:MAG: hypothetical protein LUE24_02715 [Lachnospiraceae bacterium]|nr:hypothetical protein [Lachnospiraceae bacterium]